MPSYPHTWNDEEVTFNEIQDPTSSKAASNARWAKIHGACAKASRDGYGYMWMDTCCIDKSSSSELSEAVNSMFLWYQKADICYTYLNVKARVRTNRWTLSFQAARWFSRGWTLQELLAPSQVRLLAGDWSDIGTKYDLSEEIHGATRIELRFLDADNLHFASLAKRMSCYFQHPKDQEVTMLMKTLLGVQKRDNSSRGQGVFSTGSIWHAHALNLRRRGHSIL